MKYKTIGAFKNVQNIPYCKATEDMKVGMGVVLDRAAKTASLAEDDTAAKAIVHIVTNINDKPELHNSPETYVVNAGEYVRADDLRTVNGLEIEFAAFESVILYISTDRGKIINKVMLSASRKYIYYFTRDKIHEQAAVKRIHIRFREIVLIHG